MKVLPTPTGPRIRDVVAGVDEAQGAQLVEDLVVVVDLGGGVPVLQCHVGVEAGGAGSEAGRGGLSAGDLIGEDELEELGGGTGRVVWPGRAVRAGCRGSGPA